MTDYAKTTNFAAKDSLPSGDSNKIIRGTEFDVEFEAIETSVATKANLASPAFTGTPTAPTATSGTNTTQIATTAFVQAAVSSSSGAYPVGSIYINASDSTNPATLLGFGTWVSFGAGRVLVGLDSGQTEFDTAEETGGAKTHTLTEAEMPSHTHDLYANDLIGSGGGNDNPDANFTTNVSDVGSTQATGGGQAHNNLQPYIVVHMWKRTA